MEKTIEEKTTVDVEIKTERDIYGSFFLAGVEFALSVKNIQEVINEPIEYGPMPLAPSYLLGLFNLRGMIVPVVDLRKVFNLPCIDDEVICRKVAIIEYGEFCVGLLFDGTGEVFSGNEEEKSLFNTKGSELKDSVVQGVFKLDNGRRIIQILDAYEILNLDRIPQSKDSFGGEIRKRKTGKRKQCISFLVGEAVCAIGIDFIQEIIRVSEIKNTALSSDLCLGAVDLRGNTVPIIDFSYLLGYEKTHAINIDSENNNKVIIMKIEDEYFGLLVSTIESIISYFTEDLIFFPVLGDSKKEMFKGCISSGSGIDTILLDHEKILSSSEIELITRGHSKLYKEKEDNDEIEKEESFSKKSYITFSIDNNYALEISEVKEVIDYPDELIRPPNLSKYFKGMINLRGDLIAVVDPRILYGIDGDVQNDNQKILIINAGTTCYGLVVDSIDSIVSFSEKSKIKIPTLVYRSEGRSLTEDVKEAVQVDCDNEIKNLLILNLSSVSARVGVKAAG